MPRKKLNVKHNIIPDPKFGDVVLAKFVNRVMQRGKKSLAEKIVYRALDVVVEKSKQHNEWLESIEVSNAKGEVVPGIDASKLLSRSGEVDERTQKGLTLFKNALRRVMPVVEVKSRRVGGSTYQVPIEVRFDRAEALAMRWLVEAAKERHEKGMVARLANEFIDALQQKGGAFKKREDVHRMAKANQAYSHYRW